MEATINGARIHYERAGEGLPVLLLHAGSADSRMWEPQVEAFARHFDVIRPDVRGFGRSELPSRRWSPVEDLLGLIDELQLKPAHLVGCSLGSIFAINFALVHPERISKLVSVGPGIAGARFHAKYPELFADIRAAEEVHDLEGMNAAQMRLFLDGPRRPAGYVKDEWRRLYTEMNRIRLNSDFSKAPTDEPSPPDIERLHEISAPTLVVVGDEDLPGIFDAVEFLMGRVPNARKAVIHDAAHFPNLEHPEEFNRIVLEFLLAD